MNIHLIKNVSFLWCHMELAYILIVIVCVKIRHARFTKSRNEDKKTLHSPTHGTSNARLSRRR